MTETPYEQKRNLYWNSQAAFRQASIEELLRLIPATADQVILELNDTPRLSLVDVLDADGQSVFNADALTVIGAGDHLYDRLDQIASDMEAFSWEEADSFLSRTEGGRWIIARQPASAPQEATGGSGGDITPTAGSEAGRIPSLVHEARNILWSSGNGGHNGRPSEVKRILESICDESERLFGAS